MITVVGSMNMDLVVGAPRFPKQGETILGDLFATAPGGKGANQAVAAARLGGNVHMIGAVGNDAFGVELLTTLRGEGINTAGVSRTKGMSGIANILLTEGDNRIIVVPGANHTIGPEQAEAFEQQLAASSIVIVQLEVPLDLVTRTLELCRSHQVPVILNPAPAAEAARNLLALATYITPNETEAEELFGPAWERALEEYPNRLIVTLGKAGARFFNGERHVSVKGFAAEVADTTGAGDAFNGALGVALSEGMELREAIRFANAAASLSVEKIGAQTGMPEWAAVVERLSQGHSG
ncbi:ribokinase [Planococcus lenghuensis]|uniref:Ribokinase n=1 Tax=Planococcus lenghuensis TaxID=2213202 RepID=A0A1Q2L229_9BACL|nr:ribokinase [Planococcus lenghuensis]AQQ54424.1 ribokinase [Planococcus lenghuensis]